MKKIAIVVPASSVLQAIADPQYCFEAVNMFLEQSGRAPIFNITLVAEYRDTHLGGGSFTVHADRFLDDKTQYDLVIVPALFGNMPDAVEKNRKLIPWIKDQYNNGAEVASLCVGAFLLAATGLVDGKKCSTHWGFQDQFKDMFPEVDLQDGHIVTEEQGIYSSGGATSYWNLLLHLVEKYVDRETAIITSKYFAVDFHRQSQSVFMLFKGQKTHGDDLIIQAQQYIENNVSARLNVDEISEKLALGRRSFERRFRQATKNSVLEYIHRVKIEAAKKSFENTKKGISEVMMDVGYNDLKAFRTTFRKITGLTPVDYRNRYNKMA